MSPTAMTDISRSRTPAEGAQQQLAAVQGQNGIWLAGAWLGHGFHEDGLASALRVARALDVVSPWEGLADAA